MAPDTTVSILAGSHDGTASCARIAPAGCSVQTAFAPPADNVEVVFRLTSVVDPGFLASMLYEAVHWDPDMPREPPSEMLQTEAGRYVEQWGRPGDDALVALALDDEPAGAAWLRVFDAARPGYGFVDTNTPELSIAVARAHRGRGAGSLLLGGILGRARGRNVQRVSLSVHRENPARSMYERFGFAKIGERGQTWVMVIDLGPMP
jgi:GNAT superfamily N-acetyltransferase